MGATGPTWPTAATGPSGAIGAGPRGPGKWGPIIRWLSSTATTAGATTLMSCPTMLEA